MTLAVPARASAAAWSCSMFAGTRKPRPLPARPPSDLQVVAELALKGADGALVPLVERPLANPLGRHKARPREYLQMSCRRGLGDTQLIGDEDHADAVGDQISVALRRKVRHRITQPLKYLQPLRARERPKHREGVARRSTCRHLTHRIGRLSRYACSCPAALYDSNLAICLVSAT